MSLTMRNSPATVPLASRSTKLPSRAEFEALVQILPEAVLLADNRDGTVLMGNGEAAEITSYTRNELAGMKLASLFTPVGDAVALVELLRSLDPNSTASLNLMVRSHRQGQIPVEVRVKPLGQGNRWSLIQFETDEKSQQKLADEQFLGQCWPTLEELASLSQLDNLQTILIKMLQAGQKLFGADVVALYQARGEKLVLERTSISGKDDALPIEISPADFMALKDPQLWIAKERATASLQRAIRTNGLHFLVSAPLGQVNASIGLVVAAGNNTPPSFALSIIQTLASYLTTALQNAALTQSLHDKLDDQTYALYIANTLKDQVKDSLLVLSMDFRVIDLNRAAELTLGYSHEEILDHHVNEILISDQSFLKGLETAQQGIPYYHIENVRIFRRNGDSFPVNLQLLPVNTERGLVGILVLFQDTSEQESFRIRNEQLEQRALLGEVTASFAHEVRNPINNISTGLQVMEMGLSPNDPNLVNVRRLQIECNRLNDMIKSGLAFIKPMEYKMEALDLGIVMQNLLDRWQGRFMQHKIQSQLQADTSLPLVEGDIRAIEQVFTNLINNSVQALVECGMSENKIIGIKVQHVQNLPERSQVEVSISDNGPGVSDEIRDHIFEPFFTTRKGGTGIGLAVVKRIVTAHKGSIILDSYPGATVFRIQFPIIRKKISQLEQ